MGVPRDPEFRGPASRPRPPNDPDSGPLFVINHYFLRWAGKEVAGERPLCVVGCLVNHWVTTAAVRKHEGRRIWTVDGKRYLLGNPYAPFLEWLKINNFTLDENKPLDFDRKGKFVPVLGPDNDPKNPYHDLFHPR